MILYNGTFLSLDGKGRGDGPGSVYCGLRVDKGRIVSAYHQEQHEALQADLAAAQRTGSEDTLDCGGTFGVPGFVDTHTHSFEGGFYHNCTSLESVSSIEEAIFLMQEGGTIDGKIFAWQFEEHRVREGRFPGLQELDNAFGDTPVFIRRIDGHSCMINSAAAARIPWKNGSPDLSRPLAGSFNHEASSWFHSGVSDETIVESYRTAARLGLEHGLVRIHTMIGNGSDDLRHYRLIRDRIEDFPLEFVLYPQVTDYRLALEAGSPRLGGCILVDGSMGSRTAALTSPYLDDPATTGILYKTDDEWGAIVRDASSAGLDVCVHAIGDGAVNQIARAYIKQRKTVKSSGGEERYNQIIHCELTPDPTVELLEKAGAACVMQPMFEALWGGGSGMYSKRIGPERSGQCDRFRTLLDAGLLVTGGSDWYITGLDVIDGMNAAVNHHNRDERISPLEALKLYTVNAARLIGRGDRQGRLSPGNDADITFLASDPLSSASTEKNRVTGTFTRNRYIKRGQN